MIRARDNGLLFGKSRDWPRARMTMNPRWSDDQKSHQSQNVCRDNKDVLKIMSGVVLPRRYRRMRLTTKK